MPPYILILPFVGVHNFAYRLFVLNGEGHSLATANMELISRNYPVNFEGGEHGNLNARFYFDNDSLD